MNRGTLGITLAAALALPSCGGKADHHGNAETEPSAPPHDEGRIFEVQHPSATIVTDEERSMLQEGEMTAPWLDPGSSSYSTIAFDVASSSAEVGGLHHRYVREAA